MPLSDLAWFLLFAGALQATVGARLLLEGAPWKRLAGVLFLLNAVLTPAALLPAEPGSTARAALILAEGATGWLMLLMAAAYPRPKAGLRVAAAGMFAYSGAVAALWVAGVLTEPWFGLLCQALPTLAGFAGFLLLVAYPFVASPGAFGPEGAWLTAAFLIRIVEFARFAWNLDPGLNGLLFYASVVLVLAVAAAVAARALVSAVRGSPFRVELGLVVASAAVGFLLALPDLIPLESGLAGEVVRRLSLVLVRPAFVAWGVYGPATLLLLGPLAAAAAASLAVRTLSGPALAESGASWLRDLLSAAGAMLALMIAGYALHRRGRSEPRFLPPPLDPGMERWQVAILALREARPDGLDERFTRAGLAATLGVEKRNVHRVIEDVNRAGERLLGRPGPAVVWSRRRGRRNQMQFFYALTAEGRELATRLSADTTS